MTGFLLLCVMGLAIWVLALSRRIAALERERKQSVVQQPAAPTPAPAPAPAPAANPAAPAAPAPTPAPIEQPTRTRPALTSGQVLAVAGGALVLLGAITFVVLAIGNGWLTETAQIVLGYAFGVLLSALAVLVVRKRDSDLASMVALGVGAGVVQLINVAGTQGYDVVAAPAGIVIALATSVWTVWWALRWDSQWLAGFGIATGLAAPVLVDANTDALSVALLAAALVGAIAVLVMRPWTWLGTAALVLTGPQLATWADGADASIAIAVTFAWWAALLVGAIGYDVAHDAHRVRSGSAALTFLAAGCTSVQLVWLGAPTEESWLLLLLAAANAVVAIGLLLRQPGGQSRQIPIWLFVVASGVLALAGALWIDGPATVVFWSIEAVALAALARRYRDIRAGIAACVLAGATVAAAIVSAGESAGSGSASDIVLRWLPLAVAPIATIALLAWLPRSVHAEPATEQRSAIDATHPLDRQLVRWLVVAATLFATIHAIALGSDLGQMHGRIWATTLTALLAIGAAYRWTAAPTVLAASASTAIVGMLTIGEALQPDGLLFGTDELASGLMAGALFAVCLGLLAVAARRAADDESIRRIRIVAEIACAAVLLYAASIALVTVIGGATDAIDQTAQLALSIFWGVTGLVVVSIGLARRVPELHRGGVGLLVLAACKVLVLDTQQLEPLQRVATLIGVGLALLAGGFLYLRAAERG